MLGLMRFLFIENATNISGDLLSWPPGDRAEKA
jgi:hypothetical protein